MPISVGFRAGALSACFMIINEAATILDVDPNEFEVLMPRVIPLRNGSSGPVLQIADTLVNGSGLCDALAKKIGEETLFLQILKRLVGNPYLSEEHQAQCDQACYGCLCRFGNQPWHGLLDWRLGLATLQMLHDGGFCVGLDGNYEVAGLDDWPNLAERYAREAVELFRGMSTKVADLQLVRLEDKIWMAVVHPLWDWEYLCGSRRELREFMDSGNTVLPANTFDLSRRLASTVERAKAAGARSSRR